jgi:phosphoribosylanthranilate isomerase
MRLKVCGMKYQENIAEVAALQPNYLGFIFYEKSPRFVQESTPEVSTIIKKTGVFVNASLDYILEQIKTHNLQAVQLHGNESPEFCQELKSLNGRNIEIIKVFSIKDEFDFSLLDPYEDHCDYFLFDTKGKLPGGNGYTFDWTVLENYPSAKPYFLSGGIGLDQLDKIKTFMKSQASTYCYALDINSGFEIEPALKSLEKIKIFKEQLSF